MARHNPVGSTTHHRVASFMIESLKDVLKFTGHKKHSLTLGGTRQDKSGFSPIINKFIVIIIGQDGLEDFIVFTDELLQKKIAMLIHELQFLGDLARQLLKEIMNQVLLLQRADISEAIVPGDVLEFIFAQGQQKFFIGLRQGNLFPKLLIQIFRSVAFHLV